MTRRSLEETWRYLEGTGWEAPRDEAGKPFVPAEMPNYEDEDLGFEFFRTMCAEEDLSALTLPRTFFRWSEIDRVDFTNTDLSESRMCWNDFRNCNFQGADLSRCDMRFSLFEECNFDGANLNQADLRDSVFTGCSFENTNLIGALAVAFEDSVLNEVSEDQERHMVVCEDAGPEPSGG
jgi:BTB/POZ domain-containing protein KCTD9